MAKPPKHLPRDDDAFREAMKDVQPLPDPGRVVHPPARPAPEAQQRLQDNQQTLRDSLTDAALEPELESGDSLAYVREGVSPQVLRKLRSGFWSVRDELDLHGLRTEEARALLTAFLSGAARRGHRCLRVIHGKGWRSRSGEPVLKRKVAAWLAKRAEVIAFCEARPAEGGGGAVMVLLQARGARLEAREEDWSA